MATLQEQLEKANKLNEKTLITNLFTFIRSIEKQLVKLNKEQIHEFSSDIYGNALGFYSRATEYITTNDALLGKGNKIKREGDPFDMEDTGDFLKQLYAKVSKDFITFGSTDPKTDLILENESLLSKELFGLTDENLTKVIKNVILPFYQSHVRTILGYDVQ